MQTNWKAVLIGFALATLASIGVMFGFSGRHHWTISCYLICAAMAITTVYWVHHAIHFGVRQDRPYVQLIGFYALLPASLSLLLYGLHCILSPILYGSHDPMHWAM